MPKANVAFLRHAKFYAQLLSMADKMYLQGGKKAKQALDIFRVEQDNIQAAQFWTEKLADRNTEAAKLCVVFPDLGANILSLREHPHERVQRLEIALKTAQSIGNLHAVSAHLGNLGLAFFILGEYSQALKFHREALRASRSVHDQNAEG